MLHAPTHLQADDRPSAVASEAGQVHKGPHRLRQDLVIQSEEACVAEQLADVLADAAASEASGK